MWWPCSALELVAASVRDGGSFYMDRTKIVSLHKEFQIGETADKTFKHYNITILHYYKMLLLDYCL